MDADTSPGIRRAVEALKALRQRFIDACDVEDGVNPSWASGLFHGLNQAVTELEQLDPKGEKE